jgi:hypothetical protein
MRVPLVEFFCHTVMRWIPAPQYLLPGTRGCMWPRPIMPHVYLILRCLDDPEGLNNGHWLSRCGPQVCELANNLRHSTAMLSQDLSGAWVTIRG